MVGDVLRGPPLRGPESTTASTAKSDVALAHFFLISACQITQPSLGTDWCKTNCEHQATKSEIQFSHYLESALPLKWKNRATAKMEGALPLKWKQLHRHPLIPKTKKSVINKKAQDSKLTSQVKQHPTNGI